ncbi:MAG: MBL fold metallo-hydrolase [Betaproteobacteria bacterium]|nr:MBL fold metallo-hydrolase [Betaproteobacteria bacterium]
MPANRLTALLTGTHRYEKTLSTRHRGAGVIVQAPILAYLVETPNGRILYDVGCDYSKVADPAKRARYFAPDAFTYGPPEMDESQRLSAHLQRLGLAPADIDVVFLGHLHFDHAGGICDVPGCELHVQADELAAARAHADMAYFPDEFAAHYNFRTMRGEYDLTPGVRAVSTPGHTAGHMSLWVELGSGPPILLCGDAADLTENIEHEIAPGLCWKDRDDLALASIRKLKDLAKETGAQLWPNHDLAFWGGTMAAREWHD